MDDFFTARVEGYDAHMLESVEGCREGYLLMARLLPDDTKTLLDLGCGTGLELDAIFERLPDLCVTGVDMTRAMLDKLREKHPDKALTLICGSYLDRDFGAGAFDAAVSFETLHHLSGEQKLSLYRAVYASLRAGGAYIEADYMVLTQREEDEALRDVMKKHGLGTPATRAAILERLIEVKYAERKGKSLVATEKGCKLIDCAPQALTSAELTGKWEYGLNLIAEQKAVDEAFVERFMSGVTRMTSEMVDAVKTAPDATVFAPEGCAPARRGRGASVTVKANTLDATCPVCGKGKVTENERAFGCSRWKQGCAFTLWKDGLAKHGGPTLTRRIVEPLLRDGHVRGSTGTVTLSGETLRFTFADSAEATPPVSILYQRQGSAASARGSAKPRTARRKKT